MIEGLKGILDCIAVLLWGVGVCQEELTKSKRKWGVSGCFLVGIVLLFVMLKNDDKSYIVSVALVAMIYLFCIQEEWKRKIVIFLFSVFYIDIIYFPIKSLLKMIELLCHKAYGDTELICDILAIFCILIISYKIKNNQNLVRWIKKVPTKYYFVGFICAFAASGITTYLHIQLKDSNRATQIVIIMTAIIVNTFLYVIGIGMAVVDSLRKRYKEESSLKDEYLRLSRLHYESLNNNMREIRGLKHDMKAHLNSVAYFIEKQEWEKLGKYVEEARGEMNKNVKTFIDINHDLVNAILEENLADKNDILFEYEGALPDNIKIENFDLCTIFSNIISNGIEACERLNDVKKEIVLKIKRFQNNICIYMENPVENDIGTEGLGEWTIKKDKINHGYGIHNIITAVEKYNGEVTFQCENCKFSVEIIFCDILK